MTGEGTAMVAIGTTITEVAAGTVMVVMTGTADMTTDVVADSDLPLTAPLAKRIIPSRSADWSPACPGKI
jgi:hypothetical protein